MGRYDQKRFGFLHIAGKDYEEFLELLSEKGYQIKQGKHLAIKPQGMTRFEGANLLGICIVRKQSEKGL